MYKSHPHILEKQKLAVLLVDTQGLFDSDTTLKLTSVIFGLSTLMSSYLIFNVRYMVQEDNLHYLSLFSQYARAAMANKVEKEGNKPFQDLEFLVRDWQHFKEEEDFDKMVKEMEGTLEKLMQPRDDEDSRETRDHINLCFEDIACYGLPHPGVAVTKISYSGEVDKIEHDFLELLGRYCPRLFDNLSAKVIHGREMTGVELISFMDAYAEMFASGASFPKPDAILKANLKANNSNAINCAIKSYKETMDRIAGPDCTHCLHEGKLQEHHNEQQQAALKVFESIANLASKESMEEPKEILLQQIGESFETYQAMNNQRISANNNNAITQAIKTYKENMDKKAGRDASSWVFQVVLEGHHQRYKTEALQVFASIANFGNEESIGDYKEKLLEQIEDSFQNYQAMNELRYRFKGLEW